MPKPHKPLIPLRYNKLVFTALSIVGIVAILYFMTPLGLIVRSALTPNYAEEVAKPIEKALVEAGAVKKSSGGSSGVGPDDNTPGYSASFMVPLDEASTTNLVKHIASDNGFELTQASVENRGPLMVDDKYIDNWYYDYTSRKADFPDFNSGVVKFRIEINVEGADINPKQTNIRFDIELPTRKGT